MDFAAACDAHHRVDRRMAYQPAFWSRAIGPRDGDDRGALPTGRALISQGIVPVSVLWLALCSAALAQHPGSCQVSAQGAGGSGILFARGDYFAFILTCDHVTEHLPRGATVYCTFPDLAKHGMTTRVRGTLGAGNRNLDASVIIVNADAVRPLQVARFHDQSDLPVGDMVRSDGFPSISGQQRYVQLRGKLLGVRPDGTLRTTANARSGHSGGPIFSSQWRLLGLMSGSRWSDYEPMCSWGCSPGPLRNWLSTLGWRIKRARAEALYWSQFQFGPGGICQPITQPYNPYQQQPQPTPAGPQIDDQGEFIPTVPGGSTPAERPPPAEEPAPAPTPEIDYELIIEMLAEDERFRGPPGPQGPAGDDGADGELTDEQLDALAQSIYQAMKGDETFRGPPGPAVDPDTIAQALPPIRVKIMDPDGKPIQSTDVKLGGELAFQLKPSKLIKK